MSDTPQEGHFQCPPLTETLWKSGFRIGTLRGNILSTQEERVELEGLNSLDEGLAGKRIDCGD